MVIPPGPAHWGRVSPESAASVNRRCGPFFFRPAAERRPRTTEKKYFKSDRDRLTGPITFPITVGALTAGIRAPGGRASLPLVDFPASVARR